MARLAGVIQTSHGPFTTLEPARWEAVRAQRSFREDVPLETIEERTAKAARAAAGLAVLNEKLHAMEPDVLLVFGDDHSESFDFGNFPALSVYLGETFVGRSAGSEKPVAVPGHPELATALLVGLLDRGFDPAFSLDQTERAKGMSRAVMRPLDFFAAHAIPTIPILMNVNFPPQVPALRCYRVGKAVRQVIEEFPAELRIVAIGSGGLWHTPGRSNSYLDEEFDQTELQYLARGDIEGMAEYFDNYKVSPTDESQDVNHRGMTGLPTTGGPQMGTREICNWIAAAAVADRRPSVVVDYIPIYASPIGTAFAYCNDV
jgi:hypothetical protein